jgi:hypothetical protein
MQLWQWQTLAKELHERDSTIPKPLGSIVCGEMSGLALPFPENSPSNFCLKRFNIQQGCGMLTASQITASTHYFRAYSPVKLEYREHFTQSFHRSASEVGGDIADDLP